VHTPILSGGPFESGKKQYIKQNHKKRRFIKCFLIIIEINPKKRGDQTTTYGAQEKNTLEKIIKDNN
jgi:hypothetical protein